MKRTAFLLMLVVLVACGKGGPGAVSRAEFGAAWPLTVNEGTLSCAFQAITLSTGGKVYAVNGVAVQNASARGWRDISEIWADDPATGLKKDLSPLIDRGQTLCRS